MFGRKRNGPGIRTGAAWLPGSGVCRTATCGHSADDLTPAGFELVAPGERWSQIEEEALQASGQPGLYHSAAWAEHGPGDNYALIVLRDGTGDIVGRFSVRGDQSRALPGHRLLTVERFGNGLPAEMLEPAAMALARYALQDRWTLQIRVGILSRTNRDAAAAALKSSGFRQAERPNSYTHTPTLDLSGDADAVFRRLRKTARKNLHQATQAGLRVRTLTDPAYAERLAMLERLSMARTGGRSGSRRWASLLELSKDHPQLSRISGLFLSNEEDGPDKLMAFAWGTMQGDHGTYTSAGTMRQPGLKVSLGYPLLWDLIAWSHQQHAAWFDFGGITMRDPNQDPLVGISAFKRHFTHTIEHVGDEWVLEPHPIRARLARAASAIRNWGLALRDLLPVMALGAVCPALKKP